MQIGKLSTMTMNLYQLHNTTQTSVVQPGFADVDALGNQVVQDTNGGSGIGELQMRRSDGFTRVGSSRSDCIVNSYGTL
jgi:hypothetical protein